MFNYPRFLNFIILFALFMGSSCYSFKGISIAPNIDTYYVSTFQDDSENAPADIAERFTELIKNKINEDTKLSYSEEDPDIEFDGFIRDFVVEGVAPQEGNTTAFNRLRIVVQVNFVNNKDEDENWNQSFSFFEDFASDEDLSTIQDDLIDLIFEQLAEDIFNRAFTNW